MKKFRKEKSTKDTVKKNQLDKVICSDSNYQILEELYNTQMREENEQLEKSTAEAKGGLDQMIQIFEAHARLLVPQMYRLTFCQGRSQLYHPARGAGGYKSILHVFCAII